MPSRFWSMQLKACEVGTRGGDTVTMREQPPPHPAQGRPEVGRGPGWWKEQGARTTDYREEGVLQRVGWAGNALGPWQWGTHFLELLDLRLLEHGKHVGGASLGLLGGCSLAPGPRLPAGLQHCRWGDVLSPAPQRPQFLEHSQESLGQGPPPISGDPLSRPKASSEVTHSPQP